MTELEVLICKQHVRSVRHWSRRDLRTLKLVTIDRFSTGSVEAREVAALDHELHGRLGYNMTNTAHGTHVGNDTVEGRACVAETVLAGRELPEVASGQWDNVVVELEDDTAHGLAISRDFKLQYSHSVSRERIIGWNSATYEDVGPAGAVVSVPFCTVHTAQDSHFAGRRARGGRGHEAAEERRHFFFGVGVVRSGRWEGRKSEGEETETSAMIAGRDLLADVTEFDR